MLVRNVVGVVRGLAACVVWAAALAAGHVYAGEFFDNNSVGGVAVNAEGALSDALVDDEVELARRLAASIAKPPADMHEYTELRMVSLRRLQEAIAAAQDQGQPIPDEVRFLAGLLHVRYVFVYPEQQDIVLAGPAEGWKVDGKGYVVGITTGRPVLQFDDLLVALRSTETSRQGGMACSINPTPEGLTQLQTLVKSLKTIGNPAVTGNAMEKALGPQKISVMGVPDTSHLALMMVAADFEMKQISMGIVPSGIPGLPSYMQMAKATGIGLSNMMPRWWLSPDYGVLAKDTEGLGWQLPDTGVKCLTETDQLGAGGNVTIGAGAKDATAEKWARLMTEHYGELSKKNVVFAELRNVANLALVSTVIAKENLAAKANLSLDLLMSGAKLPARKMIAPKTVASQASLVKKGSNWMISVSGGVDLSPWRGIMKPETNPDALQPMRSKLFPSTVKSWWWN